MKTARELYEIAENQSNIEEICELMEFAAKKGFKSIDVLVSKMDDKTKSTLIDWGYKIRSIMNSYCVISWEYNKIKQDNLHYEPEDKIILDKAYHFKKDFEYFLVHSNHISKLKLIAINEQQYENAATLRNVENIINRFIQNTK